MAITRKQYADYFDNQNLVYLKAHNHRVMVSAFEPREANSYKPRSKIGGFTYFSRARLSLLLNSFEKFPFVSFWTFTFAEDISGKEAKKELNRLTMVFNRRHIGWLWVMEFQERGVIHFHFLLTEFLSVTWLSEIWGNGVVSATKIFGEKGMREYLLNEIQKGNQKRNKNFNGRWWGVSRFLNKKYSLGVYNENLLRDIVGEIGYKQMYWRKDFEKISLDTTKIIE